MPDPQLLYTLTQALAEEGQLLIHELVPSATQRVVDLLSPSQVDPELLQRWRAAEEALYGGATPSPLNWRVDGLVKALEDMPLRVRFQSFEDRKAVHIGAPLLSRWFTPTRGQLLRRTAGRPRPRRGRSGAHSSLAPPRAAQSTKQLELHIPHALAEPRFRAGGIRRGRKCLLRHEGVKQSSRYCAQSKRSFLGFERRPHSSVGLNKYPRRALRELAWQSLTPLNPGLWRLASMGSHNAANHRTGRIPPPPPQNLRGQKAWPRKPLHSHRGDGRRTK